MTDTKSSEHHSTFVPISAPLAAILRRIAEQNGFEIPAACGGTAAAQPALSAGEGAGERAKAEAE